MPASFDSQKLMQTKGQFGTSMYRYDICCSIYFVVFSQSSMSLEGSVETALLLSISGVGSIVLNQYSSTLKANSQLLCDWLRGEEAV